MPHLLATGAVTPAMLCYATLSLPLLTVLLVLLLLLLLLTSAPPAGAFERVCANRTGRMWACALTN